MFPRAVITTGYVFAFAIMCFAVSGCMVGPEYSRPQTASDTDAGYFGAGGHSEDVNKPGKTGRWWEHFADPVTTSVVNEALENNQDLKAAAARVLQAQAVLVEVSGRRWPDVSYNLTRARGKTSFNFGGIGRFSNLSTTFAQDISIGYVVDLFGKLKRAERAAWADMLATETSRQAVTNSLIAEVINMRVSIATIQRRLAIARANTESRQETLDIVERRYKGGLVGPVDVRLARENLAAAKAVEPRIELTLVISLHALDVLLGRRPGSTESLPQTLCDLPDLEPVPIGMPAGLLDRRPDVQAAEFALKASNEMIGVSIAQLFPDLTLTAGYGRSADRWRDIWIGETEVYSAVFNLTQPIFKGRQLQAQVDAAKARFEELAANYAGIVLRALREVEDALVGEELLQEQFGYAQVQLREALAAEDLARNRYQFGVERIITVLESERRRRNAENEVAIVKGQIWRTRVNLFLALGGDWASEMEVKQ